MSLQALDAASAGPIEEGSVGGGTGMIAFGFKAGSGTASRIVDWQGRRFTVGVFVQANFGKRRNFMIRGRRAGAELAEPAIRRRHAARRKELDHRHRRHRRAAAAAPAEAAGAARAARRRADRRLSATTARATSSSPSPPPIPRRPARRSGTLAQAEFIPDARHRPVLRRGRPGDRGGDPQQRWSPMRT